MSSVASIIFFLAVFSLCNPIINNFPVFNQSYFRIIFPALTLILSLMAIAPLRLRLQIKHLLLARGINPSCGFKIGLSGMLKSCEMCVCLFFAKLFWFAVFEAIPIISSAIFIYHNTQCPICKENIKKATKKSPYLLILKYFSVIIINMIFLFYKNHL